MKHWKLKIAGLSLLAMTLAAGLPVAQGIIGHAYSAAAQAAEANPDLVPEAAPNPAPAGGEDTPDPALPEAEAAAAAEPAGQDDIAGSVKGFLASIAKEAGFEAWAQADWQIYPLGPGTHSWVVLLHSGSTELGYLIISATEEGGLRLMEYGQGTSPLFSMNTLYHSLVQRELILDSLSLDAFAAQPPVQLKRWYIPPMQAVWEVQTGGDPLYLDAKTGQELPDIAQWLAAQAEADDQPFAQEQPFVATDAAGQPQPGVLDEAWTGGEPFDPFIQPVWLTGQPLEKVSFQQWKALLLQPDTLITYLGKWYGDMALYPLPVSGYHLWSNGGPFIQLEHDGSRYVPFADAESLGAFYPNT